MFFLESSLIFLSAAMIIVQNGHKQEMRLILYPQSVTFDPKYSSN